MKLNASEELEALLLIADNCCQASPEVTLRRNRRWAVGIPLEIVHCNETLVGD